MTGSRWQKWVVCLLLGAAVLVVFWPALRCGYVYYDDLDYVVNNKDVQNGMNWTTFKWALTTIHAANWHPLTWMSHSLDCQIFGLKPAGHHFTSILLHAANSVLFFLLLNRLTGAFWRSAFVAAMFGLHPLRVESVVWVAERKDVLSTFFWMLTAGAYVRYAQNLKSQFPNYKLFYALSLLCFVLGLMSKPMLVTLPFVLLLLDYWPLRRWEFGPSFSWRPVVEKIPFFVLAAASSIVTFVVQNRLGVVASLSRFPPGVRLETVPIAYMRYIEKLFWPSNLAVFYPHQELRFLEVFGAVSVLAAVTALVLRRWRSQPWLPVGWFWFLGMLVPTIGLVQVGSQAMADRYSYLPSAGLWIVVAWGVGDIVQSRPIARALAWLAAGIAVTVCMVMTPLQVLYWKDSRSLFTRAVDVTDQNYMACYNLGCYARDNNDYRQAVFYFKKALKSERDDLLWANHSHAYNNLGFVYLHEGDITNAVTNFEMALHIQPRYPEAYYNLGNAFLDNHQPDVAVDCFQRALNMDPNSSDICYKLANALSQLGSNTQAIAQYSRALQLRPGMDEAANNLAWLLATCPDRSLRNGARAVNLARNASQHSHEQNPVILGTLAAAYAQTGSFSNAVAAAQRARLLALAQNNPALAGVLELQVRQYQAGNGGARR